jgi:hypothetical protein
MTFGTWTWALNFPFGNAVTEIDSGDSAMQTDILNNDLSYFVAEIAMRKMLQRCTWSIRLESHGFHTYAPIVAAELERQLDEWHQLLPERLFFQTTEDWNGTNGVQGRWNSFARNIVHSKSLFAGPQLTKH